MGRELPNERSVSYPKGMCLPIPEPVAPRLSAGMSLLTVTVPQGTHRQPREMQTVAVRRTPIAEITAHR